MAPPKNNYFADLLEGDALVERHVEHNGKRKPVYFRRLTGAERVRMLAGRCVNVGERNSMDVDLADMLRNRHQLVHFSACKEDGSPLFATLAEVQALPDWLSVQLATLAEEAFQDEADDAGKQ